MRLTMRAFRRTLFFVTVWLLPACGQVGGLVAPRDVDAGPVPDASAPDAGDAGEACEGGRTRCGPYCVSVEYDPSNCGQCGLQCDEGAQCLDGRCAIVGCELNSICDGACRDLRNDGEHCGRCFNECGTDLVCNSGECGCPGGGDSCHGPQLEPCGASTCAEGQFCSAAETCIAPGTCAVDMDCPTNRVCGKQSKRCLEPNKCASPGDCKEGFTCGKAGTCEAVSQCPECEEIKDLKRPYTTSVREIRFAVATGPVNGMHCTKTPPHICASSPDFGFAWTDGADCGSGRLGATYEAKTLCYNSAPGFLISTELNFNTCNPNTAAGCVALAPSAIMRFTVEDAQLSGQPSVWQSYQFSEENGGVGSCITQNQTYESALTQARFSGLISGVECLGRYCDDTRLACTTSAAAPRPLLPPGQLDNVSGGVWRTMSNRNGLVGSEWSECAANELAIGLKCRGDWCNKVDVYCVRYRQWETRDCHWTQYYSEEQGRIAFPAGYFLAGVRCDLPGLYRKVRCDNRQYRLCAATVTR